MFEGHWAQPHPDGYYEFRICDGSVRAQVSGSVGHWAVRIRQNGCWVNLNRSFGSVEGAKAVAVYKLNH